jgi:competence protein ComEA
MHFRSAVAASLLGAVSLAAQTELPEAPAKATTLRICGSCHEIETVISSRRTKLGWRRITEEMVARGAEGSDEELQAIVDYLAEWFGKVNVNAASAAELEKALGLAQKEAEAIVAYREQHGKYGSFEELLKTPGVDAEKLRQKRSLVAFSE